ncbi:hypothetical protein KP509_01G057800 [Ceratopteris richardii]|nr:hypothetical protein KP509_01G057800 [Ceratopteris richardii]
MTTLRPLSSVYVIANDVTCLREFKQSVRDLNGYLENWDFTNLPTGGICSFNGVQCWNDQENRVLTLKVSEAGLSGPFPSGLSKCTSLTGLDLSNNAFSGPIPSNICEQMAFLTTLDLSSNKFSGNLPDDLANCKYLHQLHLQQNQFKGSVPWGIGLLSRLTDLDLSSNFLSGSIPSSFTNRTSLGLGSFTADAFANNPGLCGFPLTSCGKAAQKSKLPMIIAGVIAVILIFGVLSGAITWWMLFRPKTKTDSYLRDEHKWVRRIRAPNSVTVSMFEKPLVRLRLSDLMAATNDFSKDNIVASGRTGTLYKACLSDGSVMAIKRLQMSSQTEKQFRSEMSILGQLRHRNLVPLLGYCMAGGEKLLVYKHMAHGSLRAALHEVPDECRLHWTMRLKVAVGAARGFAFLHHSCNPRVIHRNISASSILLDEEFEARITDFGLARLMNPVDTHISTFVNGDFGDVGYVAPEYIRTLVATMKGDVYSFGVVLLEIITGQKAMEVSGEGDFKGNLAEWITYLSTHGQLHDSIDPSLRGKVPEDELFQFLRIGCRCVLPTSPKERPTMFEVFQLLKAIGEKYNLTDQNDQIPILNDPNSGENTTELIIGTEA